MKLCKRCATEKHESLFGRDKSKADGMTYACKACTSDYKLKYDQDNSRRVIAKDDRPKMDMAVKLEKNRLYREKNQEKVRALCSAYKKKNKHVINALVAERRTRHLQAMPYWADKTKIRKLYEVAQRITSVTGIRHHVDHIVPLMSDAVCGLHVPANLRVIAADANLKKSNNFTDALTGVSNA